MTQVLLHKDGLADIRVDAARVAEHEALGWRRSQIALSAGGSRVSVPAGAELDIEGAVTGPVNGTVWHVAPSGDDANSGESWADAFASVQAAVNAAVAHDTILIAPGDYDETVTIAFAKEGLRLIGVGSSFSVRIKPTTAGAKALVVRANNVSLVNLDCIGQDTATAAVQVSGDQLLAAGCRFENNNNAGIGLAFESVYADYLAGTAGSGSIARLVACEFCWLEKGIQFKNADGLGCTQTLVRDCVFRNISVAHLVSVGAASIKNLMVQGNLFENQEDGTAPAAYLDLDDSDNTGVVAGNLFAYATNEADVIKLAAGVLFVANTTQAGVSTGRPS